MARINPDELCNEDWYRQLEDLSDVRYATVNMPKGLPVIDLDVFITGSHNSEAVLQECKKVCFSKINDHDSKANK